MAAVCGADGTTKPFTLEDTAYSADYASLLRSRSGKGQTDSETPW